MNLDSQYKVISPNNYDINVTNNKLLNDFALSTLGVSPPMPSINTYSSNNDTINIEDIEIEEVYDPIYEITTNKHERNAFDIMRLAAEESLPEAEVVGIEFSIIKRETLKNYTIVVNSEDREGPGTINDPRLGVVKGNDICGTCHRTVENCPGHLGRIPLYKPIINPFYKRVIVRLLTIFCNTCGALLLTETQIKDLERTTYSKSRMHLIEQHVKNKSNTKSKSNIRHTHKKEIRSDCLEGVEMGELLACIPNPQYSLDKGGHKIEYHIGDKKAPKDSDNTPKDSDNESKLHERTVEDIIKIFELVSPEDAKLIGLGNNMPIDFLMFDITVPPPKLRGASHKETKNESDRMADLLISIIKADKKTRDEKIKPSEYDVNRKYIYESVKTLIESKEPKSFRGTNQVSMRMLIQGKAGIFRQFIMSKRSDFTARSVIGPDPDANFGEISVPREWAEKLTVAERVFQANKAYMNKLLQKGHITNVIKGSGPHKGLLKKVNDRNRDSIELEVGDKVNRWLQDGDWVTVNRMPTLHKQSMMSMKVKLWAKRIIGLHLAYTSPFNADFDGDEMNLHSFQIVEAIAEASGIMNVEACLPNEQNNSNIMGLVMDNVVGAYLLTYLDDIIDEDTWNDCLSRITVKEDLVTLDDRLLEMGVKKYTGRALFSSLLPADLYYDNKGILIIKGILVSGVITKDHVGPSSGSIIQAIYNNPEIMVKKNESNADTLPGLSRGLRRAALFIRDAYHILNRWLSENGFTDCMIENSTVTEIKESELSKLRMIVDQLTSQPFANQREERMAEAEIMVATNNFRSVTGKALTDNISKDNNFYILITSKAKGSIVNLSQMALTVGQQTYFGERMKLSIDNNTRVLPHYDVRENELASRGFVESGYMKGLSPIEYFYQGASAREGLLISAMSISNIGKIRRYMLKMLEDAKVMTDGSVRNSNNRIIQAIYGSDGFSGSKLSRLMYNRDLPSEDFLLSATDHKSLANQLNSQYGYRK